MEHEWENLKKLAKWREKVMYNWTHVAIKGIRLPEISEAVVGKGTRLRPTSISGNCCRKTCSWKSIQEGGSVNRYLDRFTQVMKPSETVGDRLYRYRVRSCSKKRGTLGSMSGSRPSPQPESRHAMGLAIWGQL